MYWAGTGELTSAQAREILDADLDATYQAFLDRRGGFPPDSPEHLHFLAQSAEASTGMFWSHTGDQANSYNQVRAVIQAINPPRGP